MKLSFARASGLALMMAASLAATPALADKKDGYVAAASDEIVVYPYQIRRENDRLSNSESFSLSAVVTTRGLDLRRDADVAALHDRVAFTAREVCETLEDAVDETTTSDRRCVREAVASAQPQVRAVVARARG